MEPEKNNETTASAGKITKETLLYDLLQKDPDTAEILMGAGMHCIGCPSSQGETLEEACMVHGINADMLEAALNEYLANK